MKIVDLDPDNETWILQTAELLVEGFKEMALDAWPTRDAALVEVCDTLGEQRVSRVAIDEDGTILGWIAGFPRYQGRVWELHPLVVHPGYRERGIGRALVQDFEGVVRDRGALTIWLGTDDEMGLTSLAGVDLYPDPLARLITMRSLGRHPYEFYRRLGFVIAGVVPDANGRGKPDILMAKRVDRLDGNTNKL